MSKKVILFLVEGSTDKKSLKPLKRYISETNAGFDSCYKIQFQTEGTSGDVFTRKEYASIQGPERLNEIEKAIEEAVNIWTDIYKISTDDLAYIIQITDMDGAYIPDEWIKPTTKEEENEGVRVFYDDKCIHDSNAKDAPWKPRHLHQNKRDAVNYFVNTSRIHINGRSVPYKLFFVSCNLEHIFHNKRNCTLAEKDELANQIERSYSGSNHFKYIDFLALFEVPIIKHQWAWELKYGTSWYFIRQRNENSLSRWSNILRISDCCRELSEKALKERSK